MAVCITKIAIGCKTCLDDYIEEGYIPKYKAEECPILKEYLKKVDYINKGSRYYLKLDSNISK